MNCTAHVEKDRVRIWAPTQGQTMTQMTAAKMTGLPPEKVEVMTTYCGGGFGRRGEISVVIDAVSVSMQMTLDSRMRNGCIYICPNFVIKH
jgi:isoquinoline 1-oxidoreductase beta subunit